MRSDNNIPAIKLFLREVQDGLVPKSIWPHGEAGHTQDAKREVMGLFPGETPFGTPKPE
jgi:adenine-specific DNA-methyltransferase